MPLRPPRARGPLGVVLLLPVWVLLGVAMVVYVVGIALFAFLAVLVATLRLLLTPPLSLLARLPGVRQLVERRRTDRYARAGVAVIEDQLRARARGPVRR